MALFSLDTETQLKAEALTLLSNFLQSYTQPKPRQLGLMTAQQVKEELGIKSKTLARWEKAGLKRYRPPLEDTRKVFYKVSDILDNTDPNTLYELDTEEESMENRVLYKHKPKDETFKITRDDTGAYVVSGPGIERAFLMTDFNRDASVRRFAQQMRSMGVDDALRERGCKNGDTVKILKGEFEFVE